MVAVDSESGLYSFGSNQLGLYIHLYELLKCMLFKITKIN